ncbi:MAG: hypothetical protein KDC35_10590 [Acidobacteria bacterium]|nr:hypothetical protein [Acidobacteriota bacterium]
MRSLLLLGCIAAWAQVPDFSDSQIVFSHLGIKDGLSQSSVFEIVQDNYGFLWFATEDGLNKFDGYKFTVYQNDGDQPDSLLDNWVKAICVDANGDLWVGTRTGLNQYQHQTDGFRHFLHSDADLLGPIREGISEIVQDHDGFLWIGSFAGGLTRFNPKDYSYQAYGDVAAKPLNDQRVRAILVARDHTMWVGTKNGLHEINPVDLTYKLHLQGSEPDQLTHSEVRALCEDDQGAIWAGTTKGLNRLDRETGTYTKWIVQASKPDALPDDWINTIFQDPIHKLVWAGTRNGGLLSIDPISLDIRVYRGNTGLSTELSSDNILCLFLDRSGVFWAGCYLAGLNKFSMYRKKFNLVRGNTSSDFSLSNNNVRSLYRDLQKRTWVGTIDGLNQLDEHWKVQKYYRHDPNDNTGLSEYQVLCINEDAEGQIWVGTYGAGLNILNQQTGQFEYYASTRSDHRVISNDYVHTMLRSADDTMWIGTRDGMQKFIPEERRFETAALPEEHDSILHIYEDRHRHLWVGTYGSGLLVYDPVSRKVRRYTHDNGRSDSLSSDYVTAVCEDNAGDYWVGTFSGLNRLRLPGNTFEIFNTKAGLPNAVIHALLRDDQGDLWASTNRGIVRLRMDGADIHFRSYDVSDGLQANEFLSGSAHQSADGMMMFGGTNGFNAFYPSEITESPYVPPLVITSFKVFDQERLINRIDGTFEPVVLHHDEKFISFEFAALDYTYPDKNQYRHKLEGFDSDWSTNDRRYISYSNLSGGNYTFRVQGSNHDGVWNEKGLALPIKVIPPFWQRLWFIALCLLSAAGLIFWRMQDLSSRNTMLETHVAERTADLKAAHDDLLSAQQQLVDSAHKAGMAEMAIDILHNIGNALNSVYISAEMIQDQLSLDRLGDLCRRLAKRSHNDREETARALTRIADASTNERSKLHEESRQIQVRVNHIKEIISAQQDYALVGPLSEELNLRTLIDDSLTIMSQSIANWHIHTEVHVSAHIVIYAQKSRMLQVMINIVKNACEAMNDLPPEMPRNLSITAETDESKARVRFLDTGHGIEPDEMDRLFSHGFTKKEHGHGFGLHFCANAMTEMGGKVLVASEGPGLGASFYLEIPLKARSEVTSTV